MPARSRKAYLVVFAVLAVLTAVEVALKYLPIPRGQMVAALIVLAASKAACVALFFMHLRDESRSLKLLVTVPLALPVLFAVALVAEAIARSAFT